MSSAAIIQARMGSRRLPGKVLMPLAGRPALAWVVERARRVPGLDRVVVATSREPADDRLVDWCAKHDVPVQRGSESDVLARYVEVARALGVDTVMRITADCPLLDPLESARVLELFRSTRDCDYASNLEPRFLPDGLDTEVVRRATLERLDREVVDAESREHVTLYIRRHPERFRTAAVSDARDHSALRLTLDRREDLERLSQIARLLAEQGSFGHVEEIVALLRRHPELAGPTSAIAEKVERS